MNTLSKRLLSHGLKSQKVFVLPTKEGYFFFLILFVIFCMGLVYGNNMCFLIAFLMFGQFIISLFVSHKNVQKIEIEKIRILSSHVNQIFEMEIELKDKQYKGERLFLEIDNKLFEFSELKNHKNKTNTSFGKREFIRYSHLRLYSTHPFNLFKTWRYFALSGKFFIYPEIIEILDAEERAQAKGLKGRIQTDADFQEHKKFEKGHSMKRIDWKKFALNGELYLKKFDQNLDEKLKIDFEEIQLELEEKIKFITSLLYYAQKENVEWQLKLNNEYLEGPKDYFVALEALTKYE